MPAAKLNLTFEQGADYNRDLIWKTGVPAGPVPLTGYTARMQVRPSFTSATVLLELTTENSGLVIDEAAGKVSIKATAVQTAAITAKAGVYDLELVAPGGAVKRFVKGTVTISPEVTR